MQRNHDSASVRVEFESTGPGSDLDIPDVVRESGGPGSGGPQSPIAALVGAGLLALVVIAALFVLRPASDEAADGSQRGTTTTIAETATTTSTTASSTTTTELEAGGRPVIPEGGPTQSAEVVDVQGMSVFPIEIISSGGGYVALAASTGQSENPVLFGSSSGKDWVRLEGRLPSELLAQPTNELDVQYFYEALGEADDGLAVSLLERFVDRESGETVRIHVTRLITVDGSAWTQDPGFQRMEIEGVAASPSFNGSDLTAVAVLPAGRGNPQIERVLSDWAVDPEIADGCFTSAFRNIGVGGEQPGLRLQRCDDRSLVVVEPDQLRLPLLASELQQCLLQLSTRSAPTTDIYMQRRGDPSIRIFTVGTSASTPVLTSDGARAAVLVPGSSFENAPGCADFAPAGTRQGAHPGIEAFSPNTTSIRSSSGGVLGSTPIYQDRFPIAVNEDTVVIPFAGEVYSANLTTGEWALEAEAFRSIDWTGVAPNGRQIFTTNRSLLMHAEVGEPWEVVALDRPLPDQPLILHADDARVFFGDGAATVMVEFPGG